MNQKRSRSLNWDEEEKQLFRSVLKKYAHIIENKSLDTNTNKMKTKAWEEFHKKFNELNGRQRQLSQLKIQWKTMKLNARKTYTTFKKESTKTGGGTRPASANDAVIEIKDLLNPAELLRDHNIYDSDGIEICIEDVDAQVDTQIVTPIVIPQDNTSVATLMKKNISIIPAKKLPKQKLITNISEKSLKSKKDHDNYVSSILNHSKILKEEEHRRRMEMAEEEHTIKMSIHKEKLKCAIIEREILELKKRNEEKM